MVENEFYTENVHGPLEYFPLGDFRLEEGGTIRGCRLAYSTVGELSPKKDNAILFPHMYSGSSMHMRAFFVGPGRALDSEQYFVILPNMLGNGLSASPHNAPPPFNGPSFPKLTIGDDVEAQYRLVTEKFGIDQLQLVLGWSMGAQQTYEWAVRHPEMVKRAAPIAGTARCTPHDRLFTEAVSEAIRSDPAWDGGWYTQPHAVHRGLRRHAHIFAMMGLCTEFYNDELWRKAGFTSFEDFLVGFWENWFIPMDPNNLLCMLSKWQRGDVGKLENGDLAKALGRIKARTTVIAYREDMFVPARDCEREQRMIRESKLKVLPSLWGHFAPIGIFPEDKQALDDILAELLATPA
ncbi:MAG: alpha/beta fold hydrolase [Pseudomonadota bacterium]